MLTDVSAGVSNQQVDGAELGLDALDHCLDGGAVGHVCNNCQPAGLAGDLLHLLGRAGTDGDPRAGGGELARDVRADPAAAAGHERHLALELPIGHPPRIRQAARSARLPLQGQSAGSAQRTARTGFAST